MGMTENAKILALRLLDRFNEHISAQLLLLRYQGMVTSCPYFSGRKGPVGFRGLHGVSFLGIVEMVDIGLETNKWDLNQSDYMGCTALIWAAMKGYEGVVKILLEREGIGPDRTGTIYGQTPPCWAAEKGDEGQCSEPSGGPTGTAGIMPRRRDGTGPLTVVLCRSSYAGDGRARLGRPGPTR